MIANSELVKKLKRSDLKANAIRDLANDRHNVRVGQVRDSIDIDRQLSHSSFAVVTQITYCKLFTRISYDLVTDHGILRNQSLGLNLFTGLFPVIYLNHVNESAAFGGSYKAL